MSDLSLRVHPSIGFARVGNSSEYYLAPETTAGITPPGGAKVSGGLPIKRGTLDTPITSDDLRDNTGALRRQAARFRIYAYSTKKGGDSYPNGGGVEVVIGSKVGGKVVKDIVWTVHLANKKANGYRQETDLSVDQSLLSFYKDGGNPGLRNQQVGEDPHNPARIRMLTIDAGPRVVRGSAAEQVAFNRATPAAFADEHGAVHALHLYPKSYPADHFPKLSEPHGPLDTLGEMETDDEGRLIVAGGYGRAVAWAQPDGEYYGLPVFVDNDGWFDDTSDGPVDAVIVFEDGSTQTVAGAWVVTADPAFAPQTLNIVPLWDDMFDSWIRNMGLRPDVYDNGYREDFKPNFREHIHPIFRATQLQTWNTNLPSYAIDAHNAVGDISEDDDPGSTIMAGLTFVRNPKRGNAESQLGAPLMPLALGDAGQSFLSLSLTQYFFLEQWNAGKFTKGERDRLGPGERLDKVSLMNCLGGRFTPGIEFSFIIRLPDLYKDDWRTNGGGPFRIAGKPLDYRSCNPTQPFLTVGFLPLQTGQNSVEPGDICKFMAVPWQTDYNSCAIHTTEPNIDLTLYWSWPAERPVAVYRAEDVKNGKLGEQRYSVRGDGTTNPNPALMGRFQDSSHMLEKWSQIGIIIQGTAIGDGTEYSFDQFLEVESRLDEPAIKSWPMNATHQEPA